MLKSYNFRICDIDIDLLTFWITLNNKNSIRNGLYSEQHTKKRYCTWPRILVQVTIYRRLLIGRDGHLDQSEAYDIS